MLAMMPSASMPSGSRIRREAAEAALAVGPSRPLRELGLAALTAHEQEAVDHLDLEVVGGEAGKVDREQDVAVTMGHVGRRQERGAARGRREDAGERIDPQHGLCTSSSVRFRKPE
jgi:hypothetical protein